MNSKKEIMAAEQTAPMVVDKPDLFVMIGQAASNPDFSPEKMQALINMQIQMDEIGAKKQFTIAMVEFSRIKPRIIKNKDGHNNKYASLDSICRQINQPLYECGFTFNWLTETNDNKTKVVCVLSHIGGHSIESSMEKASDTSGNKNELHGTGSTTSYLERYTLKAVLGLVEEGEDDDGTKAKLKQAIDQEQVSQIEGLIEEASVDLIKFCKAFDIGAIAEMDSAQFGLAVKQLNAKKGSA